MGKLESVRRGGKVCIGVWGKVKLDVGRVWEEVWGRGRGVKKCVEGGERCGGIMGVGGGVRGDVGGNMGLWGRCGEVRCGEVFWGVGEGRRDVGKCVGEVWRCGEECWGEMGR